MKTPAHWYDVYPRGSKEGDEEQKVFTSLARNSKWVWRSVSAIAKEVGLSKERVEEILYKLCIKNPDIKIKEVAFTFKKRMFGETKRNLIFFMATYLWTIFKLKFSDFNK